MENKKVRILVIEDLSRPTPISKEIAIALKNRGTEFDGVEIEILVLDSYPAVKEMLERDNEHFENLFTEKAQAGLLPIRSELAEDYKNRFDYVLVDYFLSKEDTEKLIKKIASSLNCPIIAASESMENNVIMGRAGCNKKMYKFYAYRYFAQAKFKALAVA